ncbi:hypothetical protein G9H71_04645 [Motilibacter sp. E257]|uniref:Uncharacterized protein n=1 Tax=Motilibacter deserti TaxID=2714956 RepID=A0ABX0GTN5_9ACTN|nr:hypothetical protein [Motilibacter deserti]
MRGSLGRILAILGTALNSPPAPDQHNKVVWVASPDAPSDRSPLRITATLAGTGQVVRREVPNGPGPSIVDLPAPGCWHLDLAWGPHTDSLDLVYVPPR